MPTVRKNKKSNYQVLINGHAVREGSVVRSPARLANAAGYVNTLMGTGHSRWMIAPGPWMSFSMVKLSPDNQNGGWQAGYDPTFESIGTFSHIHEWTMAGRSEEHTSELQSLMRSSYAFFCLQKQN